MKSIERKRLIIFLLVAYGVTAVMSIFMARGVKQEIDVTSFMNVQMMYPACGVMLARLFTRGKDEKLPTAAYVIFLIGTVIMMAVSVVTVVSPASSAQISTLSEVMIILISVLFYVLSWSSSKEKRENAGLLRRNIAISAAMIVLFIVLYYARFAIGLTISGIIAGDVKASWIEWINAIKAAAAPDTNLGISSWLMVILSLPVNFFLTFAAFLGEEYGWRYYLQPVMFKKFGAVKGVLLLGVVWGIWHMGADFMFYTTTSGPQMFVSQIITCVSMAIFMGYAYMKTQNIWVPVVIHYLNNNMILVLAASADASVMQNQSVAWSDIPVALIQSLVFIVFIFTKEYRDRRQADVTVAEE